MTKFFICGGRDFSDQKRLNAVLDRMYTGFGIRDGSDTFANGDASGADKLSTAWVLQMGLAVEQLKLFPVTPDEWEAYGKGAGPRRNERMIREFRPEIAVVFPGAAGTRNAVLHLRTYKCPIIIRVF